MRNLYSLKTKKGVLFGIMNFTSKSKKEKDAYTVGWMTSTGVFLEDEKELEKYIDEN